MTYNVEISILMVHMTTIYSSTTYKLLMAYKMEISSLMVHMITASLTSTYQPQSSNRCRHGRGCIWVREQPRRRAAVLHSMVAPGRHAIPSSRILLPPESPTAACNFLLMCDGCSAREHGGSGVLLPEIPMAARGPGGLRGSPPGPGHRGRQGQGRRWRGMDEDGWVGNGGGWVWNG